MDVREILKNFAFSEDEVEVYLAVLALGRPGVSEIAKRIVKNRTAVYFHIRKLTERKILRETREGRNLRFIATPPEELARNFERLTIDFKSLVPHLEALKKIEKEIPIIEVTESRKGYYKVYDEISSLPEGSSFCVIEGRDGLIDELKLLSPEQWNIFFSRIVGRKIKTRGLFTEESLLIPHQKLGKDNLEILQERIWDLRSLPEEVMPIKQLLLIYGDRVSFLFPDVALVMTIKHSGITDFLSGVFEGLYGLAKPVEKAW